MNKARALIVDDDASVRRALKTILKLRGFEVIEACDGLQALDLLTREVVDVVFSDVSMPNVNGFELLGRIRRQSNNAKLPVVMLTSENTPDDLAKGKRLGCSAYLIKPFNSQKLDEALLAANLGSPDHLS